MSPWPAWHRLASADVYTHNSTVSEYWTVG
jgi:hypothetical protein